MLNSLRARQQARSSQALQQQQQQQQRQRAAKLCAGDCPVAELPSCVLVLHNSATTYLAAVAAREELQGADLESWNAVQSEVEEMGFSAEEAEKVLIKAFAWKKGYWGSEKKEPEVPTVTQASQDGTSAVFVLCSTACAWTYCKGERQVPACSCCLCLPKPQAG